MCNTLTFFQFYTLSLSKIGKGHLVLQESNFDHKQHCNNYDTVGPVVELGLMLPSIL